MTMFDIDDNTMVNLENISFIRFEKIEGQKSVVVGVGGQAFMVPISKHKDFFEKVTLLGAIPNKQFVSV